MRLATSRTKAVQFKMQIRDDSKTTKLTPEDDSQRLQNVDLGKFADAIGKRVPLLSGRSDTVIEDLRRDKKGNLYVQFDKQSAKNFIENIDGRTEDDRNR